MTVETIPYMNIALKEAYKVTFAREFQRVPAGILAALAMQYGDQMVSYQDLSMHLKAYKIYDGNTNLVLDGGEDAHHEPRAMASDQFYKMYEDFHAMKSYTLNRPVHLSMSDFKDWKKTSLYKDQLVFPRVDTPEQVLSKFQLVNPLSRNYRQTLSDFDSICKKYSHVDFKPEEAMAVINKYSTNECMNANYYFGLMAYTNRSKEVKVNTTPEMHEQANRSIQKSKRTNKIIGFCVAGALVTSMVLGMCSNTKKSSLDDENKNDFDDNKRGVVTGAAARAIKDTTAHYTNDQ
jgi:hypothetical protein